MSLSDNTAALDIVVGSRNQSRPGLQQAEGDVNHFSAAVDRAKGPSLALFGLLSVGTVAVGALGLKAIGAAADMEQARIAFTTMLGDGKKADAFIKDLQHFAATTPFEFVGLQDSAKRLMAMGFAAKDVIPTMTSVGNAVAALGSGQAGIDNITYALGQMKSAGKVHTQDMMQLTNAGIAAWDMLAKKLGTTVTKAQDMVQKGEVDSQTGLDAMMQGMNTRYAGLMEKQSHTVTGIMSNIQDAVGQSMAIIGKQLIDGFDLKSKLAGVSDGLAALTADIQKNGLGVALGHIVEGLTGISTDDMIAGLKDVGSAFRTIGDAVGKGADVIGKLTSGPLQALKTFAGEHFDIVLVVIAGAIAGLLVPALWAMVAAIGGAVIAAAPFLLIGGAIAALAYLIVSHWSTIYPAIKPILDALGNLATVVFTNIIKPAVMALVWVFQSILVPVVAAAAGFIIGHWNGIRATIVDAIHFITAILKGDWGGAFNAVKDLFGRIAGAIIGIFSNIHIPMPHFSFKGSMNPVDWAKGNAPGLDVSWYGQGGSGVAWGPTLIGIGERGPEAFSVRPLGAGPGGGVVYNIVINGDVDSEARVQQLGAEFNRQRTLTGGGLRGRSA